MYLMMHGFAIPQYRNLPQCFEKEFQMSSRQGMRDYVRNKKTRCSVWRFRTCRYEGLEVLSQHAKTRLRTTYSEFPEDAEFQLRLRVEVI